MIDLFLPSVLDSRGYNTQEECLNFIGLLTKGMSISHAHEILTEYLLPHVGKHNYVDKAYFLGLMVFKVFSVKVGISNPTDRDNFKHKRIELVGPLLYNLFNEYYKIQTKSVHLGFEQILYYNKGQYESNFAGLIRNNYSEKNNTSISHNYIKLSKPKTRKSYGFGQIKQISTFLIKADLQTDVYNLFVCDERKLLTFYDVAYIPNYKSSVYMNSIFRNIKENHNLDFIEESDDESDFEDIREDKYVDLKLEIAMECVYHTKFKRWVPIQVVYHDAVSRIVSLINLPKL